MKKQAFDLRELASDAAQKALSEIGNLKDIRERPFEILFKYIWPGLMLLKGRWILAALFGVIENVLGVGASTLGAMIDKAIGKGPGSGNTGPVSESSLETAAKGMVDRVAAGLFSKSSAFREDIRKRGVFDAQSLIVAWAHGPDRIGKQAGNLETQIRSFLAMSGYRKPGFTGFLSGAILSLLKALLVGVGIHTGLGMLLGGSTGKMPFSGERGPSMPDAAPKPAPGMRLYTNPARNVERSLVMALDNLIKDKSGKPFSQLFADLKGYAPVGSQEMDRILAEVRAAHGSAPIREIDNYRTFAAPPLPEVARMLLPQATYTKQAPPTSAVPKEPDDERELRNLFGGPK